MSQKKLPRDFMGIAFYVLGWIVGLVFKAVFYTGRFILTSIYSGFKRDQFNRRLRLAEQKTAADSNPHERALGREELRFLAAGIGLTNSKWHMSVKLRRRVMETLERVRTDAVEKGDFGQVQGEVWIYDVSNLLFTNFDRNLLNVDNSRDKKRKTRFSRNRIVEANLTDPHDNILTENTDLVLEVRTMPCESESSANSEIPEIRPAASMEQTNLETSKLPPIETMNVQNFSIQSADQWASDGETALDDQP